VKRSAYPRLNVHERYMSVHFINPYRFSSPTYLANAAHFNSANYLYRNGSISTTNSATCLASFWIKFSSGNGTNVAVFGDDGPGMRIIILRGSWNGLQVGFSDSDGVTATSMDSGGFAVVADETWHHVLIATNSNNSSACKLLVDGVNRTGSVLTNSVAADFSRSAFWKIGGGWTINNVDADIAEFFFAPGQWLDLTNAANVAKFRDVATGKPVMLGSNGELPTGIAPAIYMKLVPGSYGVNSGTGGSFGVNGTLTEATPP
jgi:hypothetical protein